MIVGEKPIVMIWNPDSSSHSGERESSDTDKNGRNLSDASDVCDGLFSDPHKNNTESTDSLTDQKAENMFEGSQKEASLTSLAQPMKKTQTSA